MTKRHRLFDIASSHKSSLFTLVTPQSWRFKSKRGRKRGKHRAPLFENRSSYAPKLDNRKLIAVMSVMAVIMTHEIVYQAGHAIAAGVVP